MNLYISDTHFGHINVIKFDHRPWDRVEAMDKDLIRMWNNRVSEDDDVYFLGDFCYRAAKPADWYLSQLKGHKHLIIGNHERDVLDNKAARDMFESINDILEVKDTLNEQTIRIVLCHYPIFEWNGKFHGSWHIYGHIHNNLSETYDIMSTQERALNAGVMINNYAPATFKELIANNRRFQDEVKNGWHK